MRYLKIFYVSLGILISMTDIEATNSPLPIKSQNFEEKIEFKGNIVTGKTKKEKILIGQISLPRSKFSIAFGFPLADKIYEEMNVLWGSLLLLEKIFEEDRNTLLHPTERKTKFSSFLIDALNSINKEHLSDKKNYKTLVHYVKTFQNGKMTKYLQYGESYYEKNQNALFSPSQFIQQCGKGCLNKVFPEEIIQQTNIPLS